mmetsp:Transcript_148995/g.211664  ORF Transcript_148995/g.211664 Transcript_148995/m.211664 type:complete len:179 (+) Transcript_148995:30-566(+)
MDFTRRCFILAALAQITATNGEALKTVPGFASQSEMQHILGSSQDLQGPEIPVYSKAFFPQAFIDRLCAHSPSKICEFYSESTPSQVKTFRETTPLHTDSYVATKLPVVDETVSFVFLNDNPDAMFVHGEQEIAVEAGKLVTFNGNVPHNTVVLKGFVQMAGPFGSETLELSKLGQIV